MSSTTRRTGRSVRSVALAAAGTLTFGVLPAFPAAAGHGVPADLTAACDNAPASTFADRADYNARLQTIADCLAGYETDGGDAILKGTGGNANFDNEISRAQFAAIVVRLAEIAGETVPAAPAEATFPDVATTNGLFAEVEAAVALGLFAGTTLADEDDLDDDGDTTETLFLPGASISYAQVVKAIYNYMDAQGEDVTTDDGNTTDTGLDCRIFNTELDALVGRSLITADSSLPAACVDPATRGEAFDLLTATTSYQVAVGSLESAFEAPVVGQTGTVIDSAAASYTFVDDATGDTVVVATDASDTFTVDGTAVSSGIFDGQVTPGDIVNFVDDETTADADEHTLTNVEVTSGYIDGITATTFDIVEPNTGTVFVAGVTFGEAEDVYSVDGAAASEATFTSNLQAGDWVELQDTDDTDAEAEGFVLTNMSVSDVAATVAAAGDPVTFDLMSYSFAVTSAGVTAETEVITIDGAAATFADLQAELTDNDDVTVARAAGVMTIDVTNAAVAPVSGTVTESFGPLSIDVVDGDEDVNIAYTAGAAFTVDGLTVTQTEFEAEVSAGDTVTYQAADAGTSTDESIALTNGDLQNLFVFVTAGTDDALVNETVDLQNAEGGTVFAGYTFAAEAGTTARYSVNGAEVSAAQFQNALHDILADQAGTDYEADDTLEVTIVEDISTTFDLTTDNSTE